MPEASSPTATLREEHQLILTMLDVLDRLLQHGRRGGALDFDSIEECVTFYRAFADACHHGKEEDLLFPELESRGVPREGGPIGVMLYEHQQGRALVRQMQDSLPGARAGEPQAVTQLQQAGQHYIDLLRNHIHKEDNILFNIADRVVDPHACERLCGQYAEVCARKFDDRTKEQLRDIAAELSRRVL